MTNKEFSEKNEEFRRACYGVKKKCGIEIRPTSRQASKYRNKKGLAWKHR
jgi:hypothetical protein